MPLKKGKATPHELFIIATYRVSRNRALRGSVWITIVDLARERSGLQTHIATTENVLSHTLIKS